MSSLSDLFDNIEEKTLVPIPEVFQSFFEPLPDEDGFHYKHPTHINLITGTQFFEDETNESNGT